MDIVTILNQVYVMPEPSRLILQGLITEISLPKGTLILKSDRVEGAVYFIKRGIARAYTNQDNKETTFWFGQEGDLVISMKSYVENGVSYENIELLEDADLYVLDCKSLQELYLQDVHIANWGRKLAEFELIKTEARLISSQSRTATEQYQDLLKKTPTLLQRVQLGYIASYLGITQVSLSRVRTEMRKAVLFLSFVKLRCQQISDICWEKMNEVAVAGSLEVLIPLSQEIA
jgi:CRP-like cAMP-binding protein